VSSSTQAKSDTHQKVFLRLTHIGFWLVWAAPLGGLILEKFFLQKEHGLDWWFSKPTQSKLDFFILNMAFLPSLAPNELICDPKTTMFDL